MQTVIDTHTHLDESIPGTADKAAYALNEALTESGVMRAVVLHLEFQRWSIDEFANAIEGYDRLVGFVNINPNSKDAISVLDRAINELKFQGLKLHPRLLKHSIDDEKTIHLVRHAGEIGIPIVICGFPDGDWLMQGASVLKYANLAKACPDTRIVVAHMGGHHVIDLMMLAKRIPNLYLDTSYSLLYYNGSSVVQDLIYAMRSMKFERIFYGSDYPDRTVEDTLAKSRAVFSEHGLNKHEISKLLYSNAKDFFGWNDL